MNALGQEVLSQLVLVHKNIQGLPIIATVWTNMATFGHSDNEPKRGEYSKNFCCPHRQYLLSLLYKAVWLRLFL